MEAPPPRSRNPLNDWYSPYFGPTTLVLAAAVLIASVQIGKLMGSVSFLHDVTSLPTPASARADRPAKPRKPIHHVTAAHKLHPGAIK